MKNVNTGYMIRAPTGGRTAQTLTTEYRRAAELTQRGDTALLTGRFFMRRRPSADRLCPLAGQPHSGRKDFTWHFSIAQ